MSEWVYRATVTQADWSATAELLEEHGFLWRKAYTRARQLVPNVSHVQLGDVIHLAFSQDGELTFSGSFEVVASPLCDQQSPIEVQGAGPLALVAVRDDSTLAKALRQTAYERDPVLAVYTGWHVREVTGGEFEITPQMCPGRSALHRLQGVSVAAAAVPVAPREPPKSGLQRSVPKTRRQMKGDRFLGVDWSGAQRAGDNGADGERPQLVSLERPFPGAAPIEVAEQFSAWLDEQEFSVAGLDFCFGVSQNHVREVPGRQGGPAEVGARVGDNFATPEDFKRALGPEQRRTTDRQRNAPFAPTNLRMFRQTYWGLRSLAGLQTPILPWGLRTAKKVVIEVLPAHVASAICPGCRYKGPTEIAAAGRRQLVQAIAEEFGLHAADHQGTLQNDAEGDALDAVLAALAARAAFATGFEIDDEHVDNAVAEGWIYSV